MFQILFEKFADILLPLIAGAILWMGFNYVVLTPRILMADLPKQYAQYHIEKNLPQSIGKCIQDGIAEKVLHSDRLLASLYTASMKHYDVGYEAAVLKGEQSLSDTCGVTAERKRQLADRKRHIEEQRKREELARKEALAKKQRELNALAQQQAQEQVKKQLQFLSDLLTGDN